jgi:hypothetical protein
MEGYHSRSSANSLKKDGCFPAGNLATDYAFAHPTQVSGTLAKLEA